MYRLYKCVCLSLCIRKRHEVKRNVHTDWQEEEEEEEESFNSSIIWSDDVMPLLPFSSTLPLLNNLTRLVSFNVSCARASYLRCIEWRLLSLTHSCDLLLLLLSRSFTSFHWVLSFFSLLFSSLSFAGITFGSPTVKVDPMPLNRHITTFTHSVSQSVSQSMFSVCLISLDEEKRESEHLPVSRLTRQM